jgi:hypothetical protein
LQEGIEIVHVFHALQGNFLIFLDVFGNILVDLFLDVMELAERIEENFKIVFSWNG